MAIILYPKEIQIFFDEVTARIQKVLNPELILVAGSFGKGSWLFCDKKLISDFEFAFVSKSWSPKKKKQLLKSLNLEYDYDIHLKGFLLSKVEKKIIFNYSFKKSNYISLDFFDTFYQPKVLYSKNSEPLNLVLTANEIPIWEAWRLYVNRMGDILSLPKPKKKPQYTNNYYWLKIFESTADIYLIINKKYIPNIDERIKSFEEVTDKNDENLDQICTKSIPLIKDALKARKEHNLEIFNISSLTNNEKCMIVNAWMNYIQEKLVLEEKLDLNKNFYLSYTNNKNLQKKYLGIQSKNSILISNLIKLVLNPKLINKTFKFYNFNLSWRHLILLTISSIFLESNSNSNFVESRIIASKIFHLNEIKNHDSNSLIKLVSNYWKILR